MGCRSEDLDLMNAYLERPLLMRKVALYDAFPTVTAALAFGVVAAVPPPQLSCRQQSPPLSSPPQLSSSSNLVSQDPHAS